MINKYLKSDYALLTFIYLVFLFLALNIFKWVIDDLYIYFRYVDNFINGEGIVYNPGEFVEGFSSFSWFLVLSLFGYLNFPLELSSKIAGLLFACLNLFLIYKISLLQNSGKFSFLACCLTVLNLPFILWSISGFELMFYIFILLFCFYKVLTVKVNRNEILLISILFFLIFLSRPEGILFSIAFSFFIYFISENKAFSLKIFILFGLLTVSFLLFRYFYFDDILPNTYYAKIGHNFFGYYEIRTYKNGLFYILGFFRQNPQFILLIIFIPFAYRKHKSDKVFIFIIILIIIQFVFVAFSGGDWMIQYRFLVPVIPFLSLAVTFSFREFLNNINIKNFFAALSLLIIFIIIGGSLIFNDYEIIKTETALWNNLKNLSEDFKKNIPANSLAANGSSGIIPYYLKDVNFLDIVGLTNKQIAKYGYRHGTWFEKSFPEYVYSRNPGWLIMWKKKKEDGIYKFENASPCYFDLSQNINFNKYSLHKSYDVYDDVKIDLYKLNDKAN